MFTGLFEVINHINSL